MGTRSGTPPTELVSRLLDAGGRALVAGAPGTGKSTLVTALADAVVDLGHCCQVISADPGQPLFGPPGAVSLADRARGTWVMQTVEGVGSLDVARFRLPVLLAVERLQQRCDAAVLLVDAPGVFRGMAAAELLPGLVRVCHAATVIALDRHGEAEALRPELEAAGAEVILLPPDPAATNPSPRLRVRRRSEVWQRWLEDAAEVRLGDVTVLGAPPPRSRPSAWVGRQAVVLDCDGATLAVAEVRAVDERSVTLLAPPFATRHAAALVVRDAWRDGSGRLVTAPRQAPQIRAARPWRDAPIPIPGPPGSHHTRLRGEVVGGLLGDPTVHLRLVNAGRSLLLDLGEHPSLATRTAHQVTDVLLSHAHIDHVAGFLWLLRRRIGVAAPCRVYGPSGTAARLEAFLAAFTWDRIGDDGPRFEITELDGGVLRRFGLRAGEAGAQQLEPLPAPDGVLRREGELELSAVVLDHRTPVLAYALQESRQLVVRADRLGELEPGPWLARLKDAIATGRCDASIELPDGRMAEAAALANEFVVQRPGQRLVYATDLCDSTPNREALVELARGAQVLLCEAAFAEADRDRALETGHLTARACGEIAVAAGVDHLVPFHLSARYQERPEVVLAEIAAVCDRVLIPAALRERVRRLAGRPTA